MRKYSLLFGCERIFFFLGEWSIFNLAIIIIQFANYHIIIKNSIPTFPHIHKSTSTTLRSQGFKLSA
jgi:hypothetical protein